MSKQPEQILENQLVEQLQKLKYDKVVIKDETTLIANLQTQLEKHNKITFSKTEFEWPIKDIKIEKLNLKYTRFDKLINNNPNKIQYSKGVEVIAWNKKNKKNWLQHNAKTIRV